MPNKTFNNLSNEKQESIIEIALKEFVMHDYDSASLNKIINEIGIAKGSFYRYFDSKRSLYLYLLDYCLDKRYEYISKFNDMTYDDFFEELKRIIYNYMKFNIKYPLCGIFLINAYRNNDINIEKLLFFKNGEQGLIKAISESQKNGKLSDEYDVEFIFYCISQTLLGLGKYIKKTYGLDRYQIISAEKIGDYEINIVFNKLINFLKNGLSPKVNK